MALRKLRKTMKPVIWVVTIAFVISIFFIGAAGSMGRASQGEALKVNGRKISQLRLERAAKNNIERYQNYFKGVSLDYDTIRMMTASGLIETQFLMKEATSKEKKIESKEFSAKMEEMTGIGDKEQLKRALKNRNITPREIEAEVREGIIADRVKERMQNVTPSAVDVEAYYALNKTSLYSSKSFDEVKKQAGDDFKKINGQRIYNKWLEEQYKKAKIKGQPEYERLVKAVVMKVGSFEIDNLEFYNNVFYKKVYFGMTEDKAAYNSAIDGIKEDICIAEEAIAKGLKSAALDKLAKQDKIEELKTMLREELKKEVKYTDADIDKYFKSAVKGKYDQEETADIKAVMFKVEASENDKKATEAKAQAVLQEALAGKDFAALAKTYSKDPGSAANGGELGWFGKGQMVPEFEKAAFETTKGAIYSKLVKTQFGYHIIKVEDKNDADAKVKAQHILITDEVSAETKKSIADNANALTAEITSGKADIDKVMKEKSQAEKKEEITNIKKGGSIEGLGYDQALSTAIFAMKEGEIKVISTDNGVYIVKQTKYVPFKAAIFAEVKDKIAADYLNEKAGEMITALKAEKKNNLKVEIIDEKIKTTIQ